MKKIVIASIWGSVVEWYDCMLMGAFAPTMATIFFPDQEKTLSLLKIFLVFAVGFIVRPLGAYFFGFYGDKHDRIDGLTNSLILTSLSTLLMGMLPSYQEAGIFSTILFVLLRIGQGFGVSGEHAGAITLLKESYEEGTNFIVSLSVIGIMTGMIFGFGAVALVHCLASEDLILSGFWRLPFIFGGTLGLIGVCFRSRIREGINHTLKQNKFFKNPVRHMLQIAKKRLMIAIGIYGFTVIIFYASYLFMPSVVIGKYHQDQTIVSHLTFLNMLIFLIFLVIFSYLTNFLNLKKMMLTALFLFIIFGIPIFYLSLSSNPHRFFIGQFILTTINALYLSPIAVLFTQMFSNKIRYSGIGLSINIASAIFGGTAPATMLLLSNMTQEGHFSVIYPIFSALLALYCIYQAGFFRRQDNGS